jgi:hypothetical protein
MTSLQRLHRILNALPDTRSSAIEYLAPQLSQTIFIGFLESSWQQRRVAHDAPAAHPTVPVAGPQVENCSRVYRASQALRAAQSEQPAHSPVTVHRAVVLHPNC